jgi:DNA-binding Lrp family transcriptional regulator
MKDIHLKVLLELMAHCRRSDREIAKVLRVSQPTVTRARIWLETNRFVSEFTLIPDFSKIGLELAAFTFFKLRVGGDEEEYAKTGDRARDFLKRNPNTVMALRGEGMGSDGILVSVHKDFAEFTRFMRQLKTETIGTEVVGSFLASLGDTNQYRGLTFKYLKEYLSKES